MNEQLIATLSVVNCVSFHILLLTANMIFLFHFDRKPHFWFRLLGLFVFGTVLSLPMFSIMFTKVTLLVNALTFTSALLWSILLAKLCYDISWSDSIFCAVAGYSVQFVSSILTELISRMLDFSIPVVTVLKLVLACFVYPALYLVFGRQMKKGQNLDLNKLSQLVFLTVVVLIEILLCGVLRESWYINTDKIYCASCIILLMLCTLTLLSQQFSLLKHKDMAAELDILSQMLHKEQTQYQFSKETIDTINRKCHDMRHQIRTIGRSAKINPQALEEMADAIDIYDSLYKTGSPALDIILAEKTLLCQNNDITISCIADISGLDFISETDIYSLFGNLLDNAINAVQELDPEQRIIGISVRTHGALLSINCYNSFNGLVKMENGLPITSSPDTMNRGFGAKSISMIAQKYGGTAAFQAENGIFNVDILIPLQSK